MKLNFVLVLMSIFFSLSWSNDQLKSLPSDSWFVAPNTKLETVCPPVDSFPQIQGVGGCKMVTKAWSGGVYEETNSNKRMWVWGGGHTDYYGNELYAFDIESLKWSRYTDPNTNLNLDADPSNGQPGSRHTYDGLSWIYNNNDNVLFAYGGGIAGPTGLGTEVTWVFNPQTKAWKNMIPFNNENRPTTNCCNFSSVYDPVTRLVYMRDPYYLDAYDVHKNRWLRMMEWTHIWGPGKMVLDSKRRLIFTVGSGEFLVYDINNNSDVSSQWSLDPSDSAGNDFIHGYGVGMDYDSQADKLVGFKGGAPYIFDLKTKHWTRGSDVNSPEMQVSNGTFGRFRYVNSDNVFVLVNEINQDVYFYKLSQPSTSIKKPIMSIRKQNMLRKVSIDGRKVDARSGTIAIPIK